MENLNQFINYLEEQVRNHSIYVWGGQGENAPKLTESWIKKMETSTSNANNAIAYWKNQVKMGYGDVLRAFDCSGLCMYYLQNITGIYKTDMSANTLMGSCKKISRADLKTGDWVFRIYTSGTQSGRAYHMGFVVDGSLNVIEAMGRNYGVVKRAINASGTTYWNAYGRPKIFEDQIGQTAPSAATVLQIEQPLMRGDAIKLLQQSLNQMGYPCGTADGICGEKTMGGIKAFAKAHM